MSAAAQHPLRIEALSCVAFRNLDRVTLEPSPHFNVLHGDNGAGKSNLLEAIYYVGALKSFRGARTDDLIGLGKDQARVRASIRSDLAPRSFEITLERRGRRKALLDHKRPRSTATWHGAVQMVLFHPGNLNLASGPPDARRAFMDRVLEQMDGSYGPSLASYQKALRSRNRLLKQDPMDRPAVRAYDDLLASAGAVIGQARAGLCEDLAPSTEATFGEVVGESMPLSVTYRPRVEPTPEALVRALDASFQKDTQRGFTAEGPHADDLAVEIVHRAPVRHHASQGQHRVVALALKVAALQALARRSGKVPLLLLDDVSSELDRVRNQRFFSLLARLGGQVFLTTTHPELILLDERRRDFHVTSGAVVS